ncbi:nitroreductase family deazaflavin-dependent oxidoreductase [Actinomadura rupiterrae]|uniref:nitroreductase family deazaflavin-dependent oxidoreductase n=1 Tax=Actinomadura rupiterrae TaxID=559627 RepID=UPI0020A3C3E6|nr:nitroreductase family deazaflavin-dependent oxidoreductase [Actinomadura rupiterrae]MCP2342663.1 deazaflavin-dependent oxidoreductase (nitroreductase family) [Actinomadura rupiterrae]
MGEVRLPSRLVRMSRFPQRMLALGLPMGPLRLLRTRGRRSGLPRTAPVALLRLDGREWLVSPFGDTQWVRNVRADGRAEIVRGRRVRRVRLVEVDGGRKAGVLLAYRRRFGVVPFVRDAFAAVPGDGAAAFAAEADRHPVFLVEPDPEG